MKRLALLLISVTLLSAACTGNVFELKAGDCFDDPEAFGEIYDVAMVECGEPHDNEVFATYKLQGSEYPGDLAVQTASTEGCFDRFAAYVGRDYETSTLDFNSLTPTNASWDQGDREAVCFLFDLNRSKLTTSVKGTGI